MAVAETESAATGEPGPSRRDRLVRGVAAIPLALFVVIGIGVILRVLVAIAVSPVEMNNVDSLVYIGGAENGLFVDPVRVSGYSIFLRGLHAISDEISFTIFVQHLIGILTACLIYATVRRVGTPVWAGIAAAAAVLLSLDQIYLEHTILAETLFALLFTCVLYCAIRALDEPRLIRGGPLDSRWLWILAAGLLLGLLAWVRTVGVPLAPLLALWLIFAIPGSWKVRIARGALAGAAAALVVLGYFVAHEAENGYFGFTDGSGRVLLGRVSPFADCTEFTPPEGSEVLCEDRPSEKRPGSDYYIWDGGSPAWKAFGPVPAEDKLAGEFAREAILAQPLDYIGTVFSDTARHFVPFLNDDRAFAGTPYDWMKIERRDGNEPAVQDYVRSYWDAGPLVVRGIASELSDLQDLLRVHQVIMLQALLLSLFGIWFGRGRERSAIVLFIGAGVMLLVIPSITATYNARYAVPLGGTFIAAAAISVWVLTKRYGERVLAREAAKSAPETTA